MHAVEAESLTWLLVGYPLVGVWERSELWTLNTCSGGEEPDLAAGGSPAGGRGGGAAARRRLRALLCLDAAAARDAVHPPAVH